MSLLIFSGTANPSLAQQIAQQLHTTLAEAEILRFADGECKVNIKSAVRNQTVCIIQPTSHPVHDNLIELCLMATALQHAGAKRIIAVVPYMAYARGESYSAKAIAAILTASAIDQLITVDLHNNALQHLFAGKIKNLSTDEIFGEALKTLGLDAPVIVAPDIGATYRAEKVAKYIGADLAFIAKRRSTSSLQAVNLFGEVQARDCILLDDIIDSAQTICNSIHYLKNFKASKIYVYATHGLLSGSAIAKLNAADCEKIVLTNTINENECVLQSKKFSYVSLAPLIADAIRDL